MAGLTLRSGLAAGSGLSNSSGLSLGGGLSPSAGAPAFDPAATAFFAAVVSAGGSVSAGRKTLYNNFYLSLRAISPTLSMWDRLWILAAENQQAMLIDLIGLQTATLVNAPTVTVDRGVTSNGSTSYVNTNYNPVANGVSYTRDAAHISYYMNVWDGVNIGKSGAFSPSSSPRLDSWIIGPTTTPAGAMEALVNVSGDPAALGTGFTTGLYLGDRTNSTTVLNEHSGTLVGTNTPAASFALANLQFYICAVNDDNSAVSFDTSRYAMFSCGGTLGSAAAGANFATAVTTFLTAIGAN